MGEGACWGWGGGMGGEYNGCQKGANSIATEEILHR